MPDFVIWIVLKFIGWPYISWSKTVLSAKPDRMSGQQRAKRQIITALNESNNTQCEWKMWKTETAWASHYLVAKIITLRLVIFPSQNIWKYGQLSQNNVSGNYSVTNGQALSSKCTN